MMMDIFSTFDPATNIMFSSSPMLFWMLNLMVLSLIHPMFWLNPSRTFWLLSSFMSVMEDQANRTSTKHLKGLPLLLVALFIMIITINFMGMLPYVFSASAHLLFSVTLGLPLWLSMIMSGVMHAPSHVAASLLPAGAPSWLNPFLVIIETLSILLRPMTLSFRLAANMTAGHIMLGLLSIYLVYASFMSGPIATSTLFLIGMGYTMFEFGICVVQAYIFCLLLSLYSDDHPL